VARQSSLRHNLFNAVRFANDFEEVKKVDFIMNPVTGQNGAYHH
jgi:hypothetical protein